MPLIKRYSNRKLYDTAAKHYVSLEQVGELVRAGVEVQVIDNDSGEELTNLTLTQIIMEQEKAASGSLPRSVLTGLIRLGGATLGSMRRSVEQVTENVSELRDEGEKLVESQVEKLLEQGKSSLEQAHALLKVDERMADLLHGLNVPTHQDIQRLQAQVEALSQRLAELSSGPSSGVDPAQEPAKAE